MSDDFDRFMDAYHAEPDQEFAKNLHARLTRLDAQAAQSAYQRLWARFTPGAGSLEYPPNQKGQPMKPRSPWKVRLAATLMIIGFLVAMPPFRALASDILQQLGVLTITNAPTYPEQELANPNSVDRSVSLLLDGIGPIPSAADVSAEVGFPVYVPQQLPSGMSLLDRGVGRSETNSPAIITLYTSNAQTDILMLAQQPLATAELRVGSAPTQKVMVGANEGVWVEHTAQGINLQELMYNNVLFWNADGYAFSLSGQTDMTLETMKSIAESLAPGQ
jgi:hypothetical protein